MAANEAMAFANMDFAKFPRCKGFVSHLHVRFPRVLSSSFHTWRQDPRDSKVPSPICCPLVVTMNPLGRNRSRHNAWLATRSARLISVCCLCQPSTWLQSSFPPLPPPLPPRLGACRQAIPLCHAVPDATLAPKSPTASSQIRNMRGVMA